MHKDEIKKLIDYLPNDYSIEDICSKMEKGLEDLDRVSERNGNGNG
ncbi:hypothetical protein MUB24_22530 [Lederbergia sp. NSJ-179]|nr:hypothetical protein [Lederbergia sp. NSJ-179]MCJ7843596.1 hypothetical protein [Lederbergia sp. NSJ-179]